MDNPVAATNFPFPGAGVLLVRLPLPGEGRALPAAAVPVGDGHVQREVQGGLQGEQRHVCTVE